ncbi:uncharacterized protein PEZ65_019563 [Lycodopsis pacificus]
MATNNNTSKYDYITRKELIDEGSPKVYQLKPKEGEIGSLKRMTVGEKNPNKKNKTILLVGEIGAGKSTLINALVNFAIGVKWEDDVWFKIVEDEKKEQSESQTSEVTVYEIFGFEDKTLPYSLTIIDTPGYGDTGGIEQDERVSQRLFDLFRSKDGVHEIDVVGLVLKAGDNRLCDRLSYIFNSVVSLFGKDLEKNIVALITHSPGRTTKNALKALDAANIKCARNEKNEPLHFLFNNCQSEARTDEIEDLEHEYKKATRGMKQFTDLLEKTASQKLEKTVDVLNEQIRLTACIQNLKERIQSIELKRTEIQQTKEALKKHERTTNEEFTVEVDEPYKDKETIEGGWRLLGMCFKGATCCTVCEENCHFPGCTIAPTPSQCEVMEDGRCTVCTNKCPAADHVKEKWRFVNKTRKVSKTLQDVKAKNEKNKGENQKKMSLLESLQKEMEDHEANKTQLLDEAYKHVVKLELIALNAVSGSTSVHLDFLIEEMEKKKDAKKVQKLKEMSISALVGGALSASMDLHRLTVFRLFGGGLQLGSGEESIQKANTVVESGIVVFDTLVPVLPLSTPAVKVTVSNVPPFIRDEAITRELSRRQLFMVLNNRNEELNVVFKLRVEEFDYVMFVTSDNMKCFSCGREGHQSKACPQRTSAEQDGAKKNPNQKDTEDRGDKQGGQEQQEKAGGVQQVEEEGTEVVEQVGTEGTGVVRQVEEEGAGVVQVSAQSQEDSQVREGGQEEMGDIQQGGKVGTGGQGETGRRQKIVKDKEQRESEKVVKDGGLTCSEVDMEGEEAVLRVPRLKRKTRSKESSQAKKPAIGAGKGSQGAAGAESSMEEGSAADSDLSGMRASGRESTQGYSVGRIKGFLQKTKGEWGVEVGDYFSDEEKLSNALKAHLSSKNKGGFTAKEVHRVRKLVSRINKELDNDGGNDEY